MWKDGGCDPTVPGLIGEWHSRQSCATVARFNCLGFDEPCVSWQVVPKIMAELIANENSPGAKRAMEAMMKMSKINLAEVEQAADAA